MCLKKATRSARMKSSKWGTRSSYSFGSHRATRAFSDVLGHHSIQQTEIYAWLQPGSGGSVVALLDRAPEMWKAGRVGRKRRAR